MEIGRNYIIPCALLTGLIFAYFLYQLTGHLEYPATLQTTTGWDAMQSPQDQSTKMKPKFALLIEVADAILSIAEKPKQDSPQVLKADQESSIVESESAAISVKPEGECEISQRYPGKITQWCGLITKYANQRNIDPDLLAALIWLESGGNPQAYSRSGAVGLMQVMPNDGLAASFQCPNGPCFANRPSIKQLEDPEFNVSYGSKMLSGLISKRGGLREALKSYGPIGVGYSYADKVLGIYHQYED